MAFGVLCLASTLPSFHDAGVYIRLKQRDCANTQRAGWGEVKPILPVSEERRHRIVGPEKAKYQTEKKGHDNKVSSG